MSARLDMTSNAKVRGDGAKIYHRHRHIGVLLGWRAGTSVQWVRALGLQPQLRRATVRMSWREYSLAPWPWHGSSRKLPLPNRQQCRKSSTYCAFLVASLAVGIRCGDGELSTR